MVSEGVGSYWPFSTGTKVAAANLLLRQLVDASRTRYVLTPNQHIGAYQVGFAAEWITREYLARRGRADASRPAHAGALLAVRLHVARDEGRRAARASHVARARDAVAGRGGRGVRRGAGIIKAFFKSELEQYLTDELDPLGRAIIEIVLKDGSVEDYEALTPMHI